jgi:hypothetical protein
MIVQYLFDFHFSWPLLWFPGSQEISGRHYPWVKLITFNDFQ